MCNLADKVLLLLYVVHPSMRIVSFQLGSGVRHQVCRLCRRCRGGRFRRYIGHLLRCHHTRFFAPENMSGLRDRHTRHIEDQGVRRYMSLRPKPTVKMLQRPVRPLICFSFLCSEFVERDSSEKIAHFVGFLSPSFGGFGFIGVASDLSIVAGWQIGCWSPMSALGH